MFAFNNKNEKPTRDGLAVALGEDLGKLCTDLFFYTVKALKGMPNTKADWVYDEFHGAWNLIVGTATHSLYTVYGQADGFVCHFFYKNAVQADKDGFQAWIKVTDVNSLNLANAATDYANQN